MGPQLYLLHIDQTIKSVQYSWTFIQNFLNLPYQVALPSWAKTRGSFCLVRLLKVFIPVSQPGGWVHLFLVSMHRVRTVGFVWTALWLTWSLQFQTAFLIKLTHGFILTPLWLNETRAMWLICSFQFASLAFLAGRSTHDIKKNCPGSGIRLLHSCSACWQRIQDGGLQSSLPGQHTHTYTHTVSQTA